MEPIFPCPCCGYLVFGAPPGSYELCPICFWEDDGVQLSHPLMDGGANKASLHEAQQAFAALGACEERSVSFVRPPNELDRRDPDWRPFNPATDPYLDWHSPEDNALWRNLNHDADPYYWSQDYWLLSIRG